jgi:hypothetical protein
MRSREKVNVTVHYSGAAGRTGHGPDKKFSAVHHRAKRERQRREKLVPKSPPLYWTRALHSGILKLSFSWIDSFLNTLIVKMLSSGCNKRARLLPKVF